MFNMHGYGAFVWSAYIIGAASLVGSLLHLKYKSLQKHKALRHFFIEQGDLDEPR